MYEALKRQPTLSLIILKGFRWESTPEEAANSGYWSAMRGNIAQLESEEKQTSRENDLANFIMHKSPRLDLQKIYHRQNPETSIAIYKDCKIICKYYERFNNLPSVDLLKSLL